MGNNAKITNELIPTQRLGRHNRGRTTAIFNANEWLEWPASSPYKIEIVYKSDGAKSPQYFNFGRNFHLPTNVQRTAGAETYSYDTITHLINTDSNAFDLAVDVNLRSQMTSARRVGLLEMKNYVLVKLELYGFKNQPISKADYEIYAVNSNRQLFLKFYDSANVTGPFTCKRRNSRSSSRRLSITRSFRPTNKNLQPE